MPGSAGRNPQPRAERDPGPAPDQDAQTDAEAAPTASRSASRSSRACLLAFVIVASRRPRARLMLDLAGSAAQARTSCPNGDHNSRKE